MTRMPPRLPRPATPCHAPTQLTHTARTRDDRASLGIREQSLLQPGVFVVGQVFLHEAREQLGLNEADHLPNYTAKTDYVNAG
jgi:hypothetical protein